MAGMQDASQPGAATPAPTVANMAETDTVQAAIDAHIAVYRAQLEAKIKGGLALPGSEGIVSRVAGDVKTGMGDVISGAKAAAGDFASVLEQAPAQIGTAAGVEKSIPRWIMWALVALASCGIVAILDVAGHALHLF